MNNIKPLDQVSSTGADAPNHTAKVQNKLATGCSILDRLMDFAASVPDFRRTDKGNIRHRLEDIIILMILARPTKTVVSNRRHPSAARRNRSRRSLQKQSMQ